MLVVTLVYMHKTSITSKVIVQLRKPPGYLYSNVNFSMQLLLEHTEWKLEKDDE